MEQLVSIAPDHPKVISLRISTCNNKNGGYFVCPEPYQLHFECRRCYRRHDVEEVEIWEAEAPVAAKFASQLSEDMFRIWLGDEGNGRAYNVHRQVLIARCPFFERMLAGPLDSIESQQGFAILKQPVATRDVFDIFVRFLYAGSFDVGNLPAKKRYMLYVDVYALADFLLMDDLKNLAAFKLRTSLDDGVRSHELLAAIDLADLVTMVYQKVAPISRLSGHGSVEADDDEIVTRPSSSSSNESVIPPRQFATHNRWNEAGFYATDRIPSPRPPHPRSPRAVAGTAAWPVNNGIVIVPPPPPPPPPPSPPPAIPPSSRPACMRTVVADYAAFQILRLRETSEFEQLLTEVPDFAVDLVMSMSMSAFPVRKRRVGYVTQDKEE